MGAKSGARIEPSAEQRVDLVGDAVRHRFSTTHGCLSEASLSFSRVAAARRIPDFCSAELLPWATGPTPYTS